jgi:hypothetical protein
MSEENWYTLITLKCANYVLTNPDGSLRDMIFHKERCIALNIGDQQCFLDVLPEKGILKFIVEKQRFSESRSPCVGCGYCLQYIKTQLHIMKLAALHHHDRIPMPVAYQDMEYLKFIYHILKNCTLRYPGPYNSIITMNNQNTNRDDLNAVCELLHTAI